MVTTLQRLDSPELSVGGFLIVFPSGRSKSVHWRSEIPIHPTLEAAKKYAASTVQTLLDERQTDDLERTNWVSVTAAIERIIKDFNSTRTQIIHTAAGNW